MIESSTKRRWPRKQMSCEAELRHGDDLLVGTILDASDGGVFFRPEAGVVDGLFTQLEEHSGWPTVGTTVALHQPTHWPETSAIIRWAGHSESHKCRGLGLDIH